MLYDDTSEREWLKSYVPVVSDATRIKNLESAVVELSNINSALHSSLTSLTGAFKEMSILVQEQKLQIKQLKAEANQDRITQDLKIQQLNDKLKEIYQYQKKTELKSITMQQINSLYNSESELADIIGKEVGVFKKQMSDWDKIQQNIKNQFKDLDPNEKGYISPEQLKEAFEEQYPHFAVSSTITHSIKPQWGTDVIKITLDVPPTKGSQEAPPAPPSTRKMNL